MTIIALDSIAQPRPEGRMQLLTKLLAGWRSAAPERKVRRLMTNELRDPRLFADIGVAVSANDGPGLQRLAQALLGD